MPRLHLLVLVAVCFVLASCSREKPNPIIPARAVTVVTLGSSNPASELWLPGSAAAWKEEDIAFQIAGRVKEIIVEADKDVAGPPSDDNYEPAGRGDPVARLEDSRYVAARRSALANYKAAQAKVKATQNRLEQTIPQEIGVAKAELTRSRQELNQIEGARQGSVAQLEVNNARAAYAAAAANYKVLEARRGTTQFELEVQKAQQQQVAEALRQAQLDLEDTVLSAPFDARVSQIHVTPGTIVAVGTPVARLVVMDPIQVQVVVSAAKHRQLETDDEVLVHTSSPDRTVPAIVYQKSTVASATTRTFTVTLLCRNHRISAFEDQPAVEAVPITGFMRPQRFEANSRQTWFIDEECIHEADGGHFAWRVVNPGGRSADEPLEVERVALQLGDIRKNLFGLFKFRQLSPEDPLYTEMEGAEVGQKRWRTVLAAGVPDNHSGGKVIRTTRRWLIRPGDIVSVQLNVDSQQAGIYVPKKYIRVEGNMHFVFLVDDAQGKLTAKKVPIQLLDDFVEGSTTGRSPVEMAPSLGMHRIAGDGIEPGVRMITSGMHYLQDGAEIQIFEVEQ